MCPQKPRMTNDQITKGKLSTDGNIQLLYANTSCTIVFLFFSFFFFFLSSSLKKPVDISHKLSLKHQTTGKPENFRIWRGDISYEFAPFLLVITNKRKEEYLFTVHTYRTFEQATTTCQATMLMLLNLLQHEQAFVTYCNNKEYRETVSTEMNTE